MGIYIPGIEPPRHCFGCSTKVDPDNRRCNIDGHLFEETLSKITSRRDEACPLVYLPPHGDLIDRDALVKSDRMVGKLMMYGGEYVYTQSEIDRAPAIIPAEEGET